MNAIVREILQGNGTNDDKAKALNELKTDIAFADEVLNGKFTYCESCDDYYLTESFQNKMDINDTKICTYEDPINSGGNEYADGTVIVKYRVCPKGHMKEIDREEKLK